MYALILKFDEANKNYWICYHLTYIIDDLFSLGCYSGESLYLPKEEYNATLVEDSIEKPSCRTGAKSSFAIYEFNTSINLSSKFKFSI